MQIENTLPHNGWCPRALASLSALQEEESRSKFVWELYRIRRDLAVLTL